MADATPTPEEIEASEWDSALEDYAPGYDKEEPVDDKPDTEKPETTTETTTEVEADKKDEEPVKKPENGDDAKKKTGDDEKDATDDKSDDESTDDSANNTRAARQSAREAAKEVESIAKDVREKMFADTPNQLADADGDPITSVADVQRLINPQTGEAFTREEATEWLLSAQQQFNQRLAGIDKQVDQIAEVNVDLKDQSDSINYQYGELLKSMPELRDQLWGEYQKTLVTDSKTGIITGMPVSLERFYDIALQPYVKLAESLEAQQQAQTIAEKAQTDVKRSRTRADRSDIYGQGKVDDMDDDEKEWASAAKDYYGTK